MKRFGLNLLYHVDFFRLKKILYIPETLMTSAGCRVPMNVTFCKA